MRGPGKGEGDSHLFGRMALPDLGRQPVFTGAGHQEMDRREEARFQVLPLERLGQFPGLEQIEKLEPSMSRVGQSEGQSLGPEPVPVRGVGQKSLCPCQRSGHVGRLGRSGEVVPALFRALLVAGVDLVEVPWSPLSCLIW